MTTMSSMDLVRFIRDQIAETNPDVLRTLVEHIANALMNAEADVVCGAPYRQVSSDRRNRRNGYRERTLDTRVGTVELRIPKLRQGTYFPDWLLERRRRSEKALTTVVATCYLLGVSTRRLERLAEVLGVTSLSKSQVSEMAKELDGLVESFRNRPLDHGPYSFLWADALVVKVREQGRTVGVHVLVATAVNCEGKREILGMEVTSQKTGPGGLHFFDRSWQEDYPEYLSSSPTHTPDSSKPSVPHFQVQAGNAAVRITCETCLPRLPSLLKPWVATLVRTIFDQPSKEEVEAQFDFCGRCFICKAA